ncbi:MAG: acetate kinase [Clostridia bacterium]|nr:acetate kinase [Clostridia bacterium]
MKVLVVNAGSSSLKYQLFDMDTEEVIAKGNAERIGLDGSFLKHKAKGVETILSKVLTNHAEAIKLILDTLVDAQIGVIKSIDEIDAIGHRVVHGGSEYTKPTLVNQKVIDDLRGLVDFAPVHAIPNTDGIIGCVQVAPQIPNVTVFDTAFHSTMPDYAYLYGIPMEYYRDYAVRRYGAHGTSHKFVGQKLAEYMGVPFDKCKLITCHIGNGSSITAIKDGKCIDTSMGFTPLEGLIMGTRCGDIDANVIQFLCKKTGLDVNQVTDILNKKSGLLGITERSSDMRDICAMYEKGDKAAVLALEMLAYRIKKYIGAYAAALDGVDGICFTAGIGENTPELREMVLTGLKYLGIKFDKDANYSIPRGEDGLLTSKDSAIPVYVISTNEELAIAKETVELVSNLKK